MIKNIRRQQDLVDCLGDLALKTYVVNLRHAVERREHMQRELRKHPYLAPLFVDAVLGKEIVANELSALYAESRAKENIGRPLSKGEIGCSLSHVNICRDMIEKNVQMALVLEDDVFLPVTIEAELTELKCILGKSLPVVILLTPVIKASTRVILKLGNNEVIKPYEACYTSGYLLNQSAARELLRLNMPVCVAADDWEYFEMKSKLELYGLRNHLIHLEESFVSELEDERYKTNAEGFTRNFALKYVRKRKRRFFRWGERLRGNKIIMLNTYD